MEERLKILKLLEEGKINSEEAARLLEALSERTAWEPRHHFVRKHRFPDIPMPDMGKISEEMNSAIATAFGERVAQRELKFSNKKSLILSTVSGTVSAAGSDRPEIRVVADGDGFQRVRENDAEVKLHYLSSDLDIMLPRTTRFELRAVSGDVRLRDFDGDCGLRAVSGDIELAAVGGRLRLRTVSGDIEGKNLTAAVKVETKSGDIDLDFSKIESVEIETRTGDVEVVIPHDSPLAVELETESGTIDCEPVLAGEKRDEGYLAGTIGATAPGATTGRLRIRVEDEGDITVRSK